MYDHMLRLQDSAAKTVTGYGTIGGVAQTRQLDEAFTTGRFIVRADAVAMDIYNQDKHYIIILEGGDDALFTNTMELARVELGYAALFDTGNVNKTVGHYITPFYNRVNGVLYPYVRTRHVIAGNGASITYRAVLGRLP